MSDERFRTDDTMFVLPEGNYFRLPDDLNEVRLQLARSMCDEMEANFIRVIVPPHPPDSPP